MSVEIEHYYLFPLMVKLGHVVAGQSRDSFVPGDLL